MGKNKVQAGILVLLCILFAVMGAVLAGYAKKPEVIPETDGRKELVILSDYQETACREALEELVQEYMETHEEILVQLKFVSPLDFQKEICLEKDNNDLADLILCENVMTPAMVSMEILRDLSDWYTPQREDTFNKTAYLGTLINGKSYSVPFACDPYVIFYNQDYYEKKGLTPAETMDGFLGQLLTVRTLGNYNLAFAGRDGSDLSSVFLQLVYQYGGTWLDLDGANSQKLFEDLEQLRDARVMPKEMINWNQQDLMLHFAQGEVINVIAKLSSMAFLDELDEKFSYELMEIPRANNQASLLHGENISLTVDTGEEAVELLEFLTSEENSIYFCEQTDKLSVHVAEENCPGKEKGLEDAFFRRQRYQSMKKNSYSSWFLIASAIEENLTEFLGGTGGSADAAKQMQESVRAAIMER